MRRARAAHLWAGLGVWVLASACGAAEKPTTPQADTPGSAETSDAASPEIRACNGHADLCDRPLDKVVFPGAHNAMSNADEGWSAPNHNYGLKRQLEDGVRAFLLDTHKWKHPKEAAEDLWLCHGFCALGAVRMVDAFTTFATFLAAHPHEVVIWVLEDNTSGQDIRDGLEKTGLLARVHVHEAGAAFPTLGALIDADQRLLITAQSGGPPPPWYHHYNAIGFDTPYEYHSMEELQQAGGPQDSCRRYRGKEGGELFLMNHWVAKVLPTVEWSSQANVRQVIVDRARRCAKLHGRLPTIVAVDHYDVGDLFGAVRELNGLQP